MVGNVSVNIKDLELSNARLEAIIKLCVGQKWADAEFLYSAQPVYFEKYITRESLLAALDQRILEESSWL